ncbi:MAG: class I SAM-dependent methyltransferase [Bacteroidia bacterium]|nr:class I SAM-dependent methyltransferase [Bacteroidia bacterium]
MIKEKLKNLYRFFSAKYQTIHLDYAVHPKPRFGHGKPANSLLNNIMNHNRNIYEEHLNTFLSYKGNIHNIKESRIETNINEPAWNNGYLPGLDIIGVYGMIAHYKPAQYIEIGSGNSTKIARKVIKDKQLNTKITSIDPYPRAHIDHLADNVIRKPFEDLSDYRFIVDTLTENDILFIDNSHRVFPNSDAMVCFMEILPQLKKGVIVHFHDIYLPYDYPQFMCDRFYNEQYTLGAFIISDAQKYKPILPNYFISQDAALAAIISPIWNHPNLQNIERHGDSLWLQISK